MHAYVWAAATGIVTAVAVGGLIWVICENAWKAGRMYRRLNDLDRTEDQRLEDYVDRRLLDEVERHKKW